LESVLSDSVDAKKPAIGAFSPGRQVLRAAERVTKKIRKDPHRRRRYLAHVQSDTTIVRSVLATLIALIDHSDDSAKPVWPSQERLAKLVGVDVRTIRRHVGELRDAGYLMVYVSGANRDPVTGRYSRRKTNRYYFSFCPEPGGGQRIRRKGRSRLQDTSVLSNPIDMSNHRPSGGVVSCSRVVIEGITGCERKNERRTTPSASTSSQIIILDDDFGSEDLLPADTWASPQECLAATRALLKKRK
jgi:hypothetical protein